MKPYYEAHGITIYNGDCREILPAISGIGLVLTDPPYGISLSCHDTTGHRRPNYHVAGDQSSDCALDMLAWAKDLPVIAFASPKNPWPGEWRQWLVWDKGGAVGGGGDIATCWKFTWELIQVARTGKLNGARDESVLRYAVVPGNFAVHPTQKPLPLMSYLIGKASAESSVILDPFAGSGSTLVAAGNMGRQAIGIEIEERYCEIAAARVEDGHMWLLDGATSMDCMACQ